MLYSYRQFKALANSPSVLRAAKQHSSPSPATSSTNDQSPSSSSSSTARNDRTVEEGGAETSQATQQPQPFGEDQLEPPAAVRSRPSEGGQDEERPPNLTINKVEAPSEAEDPFLVAWEEGESGNPQNWSYPRKWALTIAVTMIGVVVGAGASIDSAADQLAAERFGVSEEVMALQTALFLIGFGLSAPIFGPLSEIGGRVPVYVVTLGLFSLFEIGSAASPNIQSRLVCKFFCGFFGSSPLSNAGGSLADVVNARDRTYFFPAFAQAGFSGPVMGPVIGGYLGMNVGQAW